MEAKFRVICRECMGEYREITPQVVENGPVITLTVPKSAFSDFDCEFARIESSLTSAKAGDPGYMFFPTNFSYGIVKTCFEKDRPNAQFRSLISAMPVCGFCENENAVFVHVRSMDSDARFRAESENGMYRISPEIVLDGDKPDDDIVVVYQKMPFATYSDMARVYRKYQMEVKGCVPLKERVKHCDALKKAAEALELRIRMGWKPRPTPVRDQTLENEPPLKVVCDVAMLNRLIEKMQAAGIKHAELCLVGWGPAGHDGRFPQQVPSDPRYGGDDALKAFIARAKGMGYSVVCHTVSLGAYEIADNWDPKRMTKKYGQSGKLQMYLRREYASGGLNGGEPWHVCPKMAYEHYALQDLPKVRAYGFEGMHYVDELTACVPEKCYDPDHRVSRKEAWHYYRQIAKLSKELFGGYQSEAWIDAINADVDAVLYTSVHSKIDQSMHPLFDEGIPFWHLVYHGIVLSNASSQTVNYPIKEKRQRLKFMEYGGRPLLYINSKFGATLNWMGDDDLLSRDDADLDRDVAALKDAYDEYEALKYLQYEFMENHEKIAENVYRTTYSDGSVITVDYNQEVYHISKG